MSSIQDQIIKQFENKFRQNEVAIKNLIHTAITYMIQVLTTGQSSGDSGFNLLLQNSRVKPLRNSDLYKYIMSPEGAGELGFPDPQIVWDNLEKAIYQIFTTQTTLSFQKISIGLEFNFNELFKLTPHPAAGTPSGKKIDIRSWLQWTTGPQIKKLSQNYALVRVGQLPLAKVHLISHSRSYNYAGKSAGLMLPIKSDKQQRKMSHLFGIMPTPWAPKLRFNNFWLQWFNSNRKFIESSLQEIGKAAFEYLVKL